ncbi:thioredoxin domain-containing protein [Streptosporangiaceae bacterium NEAU-GS5]|nr:thioredoxin domain-containing protein [Streptosporangiaceae bacterium NEAU-GS5]
MGRAEHATARERVAAQREAVRKQEQRKRLMTIVTVVLVAVAAVGGVAWYSASRSQSEVASGAGLAPITVDPEGSVTMAKAGVTKPVLDVYEDFQCPVCKSMEETSGQTIKNLASEGKVKVIYHPLTIFRDEPRRGNSMRAGAASRCVTDGAKWSAYHDKLFADQPDESVTGFALDDLVAWGHEVGVTGADFESCVTSQKYAAAQQSYSASVLSTGKLRGTPTVLLNGTEISNNVVFVPAKLRQAVLDAAK